MKWLLRMSCLVHQIMRLKSESAYITNRESHLPNDSCRRKTTCSGTEKMFLGSEHASQSNEGT